MCSCSSSPPVYVLCIAVVVVFIQAVVIVGRVLAVAAQLCVFVPECAIVFVAHDPVHGLHRVIVIVVLVFAVVVVAVVLVVVFVEPIPSLLSRSPCQDLVVTQV